MINPFITNGYKGPEYFCDRIKETETLTSLLTSGNNVALISPRRIGKTDLIQHCFSQKKIKDAYHTFLIDIYATKSLNDFVSALSRAILNELAPLGRKVWSRFLAVITSLRSEITIDANGLPSWGIGLGNIPNPELTLEEIFRYLREAEKPCLIAIDEFQQISRYENGDNVEALLRTYIQKCPNANFIFSGSQRHMMNEMFTSHSRPFYQSVTLFNLKPLPLDKYNEFCSVWFERADKRLDVGVTESLYHRFRGTTAYMQRIMNRMYENTRVGEVCGIADIDAAVDEIIELSEETFENLLYQIPARQSDLLKAIAREGEAKNVTSAAFSKRYRLLSPSSVSSAAKGLLERDLVTVNKGVFTVNDLFFGIWLSRQF